jgi:hypothetical protein
MFLISNEIGELCIFEKAEIALERLMELDNSAVIDKSELGQKYFLNTIKRLALNGGIKIYREGTYICHIQRIEEYHF